ncbi:MAG: CotH kinase family protein [Ruminiclostridium sp.]
MKTERRKNSTFLIIATCLLILTFFMLFKIENYNSIPTSGNLDEDSNYLSVDSIKYPKTIFDNSKVHTIDIEVDDQDWSNMIDNAQEEEYIPCTMVIDGVRVDEVGIRPKGDSSLKQVSDMNSENFSFKVEFDHYKNQSFDGIDKMSLNSCSQDTTYMKDYLAQHMMNSIGVAAPLSSFVNIKLNGSDFGFYLAVEVVEKSFCLRNYGNIDGKLYKPDSLALSDFNYMGIMSYQMKNGQYAVEHLTNVMSGSAYKDFDENIRIDVLGDLVSVPLNAGKISTDVTGLVYIDNNPKSYSTIFDSEVFSTTESDKNRLINSIKKLNNGEDLENTIDLDNVIKYFVVHNFVDNCDGYTSVFSHNYYLYERNGQLSMIPWDYNLAFGSFAIDAANSSFKLFQDYFIMNNATYGMSTGKSMVNYPIDTPTFTVNLEKRPMIYQILSNDKYRELYHQYFNKFITDYFESGYFDTFYSSTVKMISPYVKNDTKGFSTYKQFEDGVKELNKFCKLRAKSIRGQLNNTIPATLNEQKEHPESLIAIQNLDMMKTLTMFSVMGITNEDINEILKIILRNTPKKYITDGKINMTKFTKSDITYLNKMFGVMVPFAFEIIKNNNALNKTVINAAMSRILLVLSLFAIVIFTILLSKYSRVKHKKNRVRREQFEITS